MAQAQTKTVYRVTDVVTGKELEDTFKTEIEAVEYLHETGQEGEYRIVADVTHVIKIKDHGESIERRLADAQDRLSQMGKLMKGIEKGNKKK